MTTINIHDVSDLSLDDSHELDAGSYARTITIKTEQGNFQITLFADDIEQLILN